MDVTQYLRLINFRILLMIIFVAVASTIISKASFSLNVLTWLILAGGLATAGAKSLNAYFDRDLDSSMKRTLGRPLPLSKINPPEKVAYFGIILCAGSLLISYLTLNLWTTIFILLGIFTYVVVYTIWLKRRSVWNIVIGGAAGSFSALGGWTASTNSVSLLAILIAVMVFLWTPSHFWSLAIRLKDDYTLAGIPMLPSVIGEVKAARYILANSAFLIGSSLMIAFAGLGSVYLAVALGAGAILIGSNIALLNPSPSRALRAFKISNLYLIALLVAMVVDSFL